MCSFSTPSHGGFAGRWLLPVGALGSAAATPNRRVSQWPRRLRARAGLMADEHLTGAEGMPAWAVLRCPHHPCPSGGDESWPNTGTTPRGRAQNSKRRSHPWPGGLGGDHQHPAARSASTAARAAIFAEHVYPSARSFEPKLQPGAMTGGLRRLITLAGTRRSPAGKTTPTHASPLFRHCPGASRCCPLRAYLACDSRITDGVAM